MSREVGEFFVFIFRKKTERENHASTDPKFIDDRSSYTNFKFQSQLFTLSDPFTAFRATVSYSSPLPAAFCCKVGPES